MKTRARVVLQRLAALGLAALLAAPAAAFAGPDVKTPDCEAPDLPREASVGGKYCDLLRTIAVPADRDGYGAFNDWGYWAGAEWAGYTDLPPGYWVYVYPNWYIWGGQKSEKDSALRAASVHGKYANLLRKICVPGDEASYGASNDWGYWGGTEWAGHTDLPAGYWVYVAPDWYIWGEMR
jgi:hypothetical protein